MSDIYEKIEQATETLSGDAYYKADAIYVAVNASFPTYVAATKILLEQAHNIIGQYADSLGKPEYYDINRDEWKVGHDYDLTDNSGICFYARINEGQYRDPCYREKLVTLPWEVLEAYMKDPVNTKLELRAKYNANILAVKQAEEQKAAELKAHQERVREDLERQQYEALKKKFGY